MQQNINNDTSTTATTTSTNNNNKQQQETQHFSLPLSHRANRWRKRGLALTPTKYGLSFGLLSLNQAGALLHIYTDGSVLLTHGGMEMGQGLHTKMVQVGGSGGGGL